MHDRSVTANECGECWKYVCTDADHDGHKNCAKLFRQRLTDHKEGISWDTNHHG